MEAVGLQRLFTLWGRLAAAGMGERFRGRFAVNCDGIGGELGLGTLRCVSVVVRADRDGGRPVRVQSFLEPRPRLRVAHRDRKHEPVGQARARRPTSDPRYRTRFPPPGFL